jgi:hypothetical protein
MGRELCMVKFSVKICGHNLSYVSTTVLLVVTERNLEKS